MPGAYSAARLLAALLLAFTLPPLLSATVAQPWHVEGGSMEPALHDGSVLLVDRLGPRVQGLRRGDVVVLRLPDDIVYAHPVLVKRIVAVAGDHVQVRDGRVRVNGRPAGGVTLAAGAGPVARRQELTVPEGEVFVMGDHRENSFDSKAFGPIDASRVIGRAWFAIAPGGVIGLPSAGASAP